jgi:hypothetical protein
MTEDLARRRASGTWRAAAAAGLAFLVCAAALHAPPVPSSPPVDPSPAACAACHAAEAAQWQRSPHATSRTNPLFAASFKHSRLRWCLDCHAPPLSGEAGSAPDGGTRRAQGIDCAACHLQGDAIATSKPPTERGLQAHKLVQDPKLATAASCAGCHQFNTPTLLRDPVVLGDVPMQDTYAEWQHSPAAARGVSCQGCHMAKGSHDIVGGHDAALLQRTVGVAFTHADGGWEAQLTAKGAGHRVPTGDPFRRFELSICAAPGCEERLALRRFGREFREDAPEETDGPRDPKVQHWRLSRDTTAPAGEGRSEARRFDAPAAGFAWELRYRMEEPGLERDVDRSVYETAVAAGVVGPDGGL